MKTTVEISDALFTQARELADREQTTLRSLIEEGLRECLAKRSQRQPFHLRQASFGGQGLLPEAQAGWDEIRRMAYEGRGA